MYYIVDRLEGEYVVLVDDTETVKNVPVTGFSEVVAEGDAVVLDENDIYRKDVEETERRKGKIKSLMADLWE